MKLARLIARGAIALSLLLPFGATPSHASQGSCFVPTSGPHTMAEVAALINTCYSAILSTHSGTSAPANNPLGAISTYQQWIDTTSNPSLVKVYDGAQSVTIGSLNTSTHTWLPYLTGGVSGGIPYFSATNVMGSSAALTNHGVVLGGGAGAAPYTMSVPASGTVLTGIASSDPAFSATPTLGVAGATKGTLSFAGNTSGTVTITPQAAAGTPTITLPNASGTAAVSATSPVAVNATTGNITCTTCATTTNGGALSATAPVALSAGGAISITGAAGQVLAGSGPAFTATPTLGVAGSTVGTLAFANATSGSITISPPTGALGSVTLSLPAATDTLVGRATTDTLTNKTFDTAGTGNSFSINGVAATANTGTGAVVRATSPTLVTPTLGVATATTINGAAIPSVSDTLVGKATTDTLTNKTFDTAGTGNSFSINGLAATANTGTGSVVRATSPTLVTPSIGAATATSVKTASIFPPSDSTTALQLFKADGSTRVVAVDTTNARVGINKTPGAFDLDVSGAANVGGALTFGTATITALTNKASPDSANDYVIIYDNAGSAVKKATVGSIGSAGSVSSVGGITGAVGVANGIEASGSNIQLSAARRTLPTKQKFSAAASGTYTTPANALYIVVELWGAGGSGGGGNGSTARGTGGAGGAYCKVRINTPAATYTYVVGAGGSAAAQGAAGNAGGNTCWNTSGAACTSPVYQAGGGGAGSAATGSAIGGTSGGTVGGSGTCDVALSGQASETLNGIAQVSGGGSSPMGGFGGRANIAVAGDAPGGGSSANNFTGSGAAGADGWIVVNEYYNFLLKRDLDPGVNDNVPAFLNAAA